MENTAVRKVRVHGGMLWLTIASWKKASSKSHAAIPAPADGVVTGAEQLVALTESGRFFGEVLLVEVKVGRLTGWVPQDRVEALK